MYRSKTIRTELLRPKHQCARTFIPLYECSVWKKKERLRISSMLFWTMYSRSSRLVCILFCNSTNNEHILVKSNDGLDTTPSDITLLCRTVDSGICRKISWLELLQGSTLKLSLDLKSIFGCPLPFWKEIFESRNLFISFDILCTILVYPSSRTFLSTMRCMKQSVYTEYFCHMRFTINVDI